jgi:hypothetical protein
MKVPEVLKLLARPLGELVWQLPGVELEAVEKSVSLDIAQQGAHDCTVRNARAARCELSPACCGSLLDWMLLTPREHRGRAAWSSRSPGKELKSASCVALEPAQFITRKLDAFQETRGERRLAFVFSESPAIELRRDAIELPFDRELVFVSH